jgi:hypothetical protein
VGLSEHWHWSSAGDYLGQPSSNPQWWRGETRQQQTHQPTERERDTGHLQRIEPLTGAQAEPDHRDLHRAEQD